MGHSYRFNILANKLGNYAGVSLVALYYGLIEALILGLFCILAWKAKWTKAPRNISFWTMISTSYEVLLVEHSELKAVEVSLPKHDQDTNEKVKGDTIYVKYSADEEDEDDTLNFGCINLPTHQKEASGYHLPDVPEESSYQCGAFLCTQLI